MAMSEELSYVVYVVFDTQNIVMMNNNSFIQPATSFSTIEEIHPGTYVAISNLD